MKKVLLFLIVLLISHFSTSAQNQFPSELDAQKWEYITWNFWGGYCERRFIKNGSLVPLCEDNFIEIFDCDRNEQNCELIGYYRMQGDSILIRKVELVATGSGFRDTVRCDRTEGLVYDFGSGIDDTLSCKINYPFGAPEAKTEFWSINKSTVVHEGVPREVMNMNYRPFTNFPDVIESMNWTEGIGSDIHPFYSIACIGDHCEQEQQVSRVWRNDTLIYLDTMLRFTLPCNGWVASVEPDQKKAIHIYPNPASDYILVDLNTSGPAQFDATIFNAVGKAVGQFRNLEKGATIPVQQLSTGLHILSIRYGAHRYSQRFVVL